MTQEHSCGSCQSSSCGSHQQAAAEPPQRPDPALEHLELTETLSHIKHKVLVLSGKGGVGKSTVAVNTAISLSMQGFQVGLMDVDIHGPSIPRMMKLENHQPMGQANKILPATVSDNLKVMSIGFLLKSPDDAVIWRGPMKMGVIKQFLTEVAWGDLDFLIIDSPPGTGDEPLSVCQLIERPDGAVIVTTPQSVAISDVRKSVNFCRQLNLPVLGVLENMSGFVCPHCKEVTDIFAAGGGEDMAHEMGIPFLGRIPIDPQIREACDTGTPYLYHYNKSETARKFEAAIQPIAALAQA